MGSFAATADERVAELRDWTAKQGFGTAVPFRVDVEVAADPDEREVLQLVVTLEDPPPGWATWDPSDVAALERAIRDRALQLDVPWPWIIGIRSKAPDEPDVEDVEEE